MKEIIEKAEKFADDYIANNPADLETETMMRSLLERTYMAGHLQQSYVEMGYSNVIKEFKEQEIEQEKLRLEMMKIRQDTADSDPTITLGDEFDSKDIYLETFIGPGKIRQVVGLHAIGHAGPYEYDLIELDKSRTRIQSNFMALEVWGNEYDAIDGKMIGRGSFRVHNSDIDREVKQWEAEGWTRCEKP